MKNLVSNTQAELTADLCRFNQALVVFMDMLAIDLSQFSADHISLRCHKSDTADRWRQALMQQGQLLSESIINGRRICLFSLFQPLYVGPWQIDCVELPYPGAKHYPHQGWEHVELVIGGDAEGFHARALALLPDAVLGDSNIKLKFSNPQTEGERLANPTLAVSNGTVTIKFHSHSIRDVVASEQ